MEEKASSSVRVGDRIFVLAVNPQQLRTRVAGDLITAEIAAVHTINKDKSE